MELYTAQNQILTLLRDIYPISKELTEEIRLHTTLVSYKKKTEVLSISKICNSILFIVKGGVRTYYIDNAGNDISSWLLFENELAISVFSFFGQQPSFEGMETLEDTLFLKLSYRHLTDLYIKYPEFNFIGRTFTEQYYIRSEAKANALRVLSAKDRYADLLQNQPQLLQRVSLGHIASYLGINQSTLSRIRTNS